MDESKLEQVTLNIDPVLMNRLKTVYKCKCPGHSVCYLQRPIGNTIDNLKLKKKLEGDNESM